MLSFLALARACIVVGACAIVASVAAVAADTHVGTKTVWLCRPGMSHDPCTGSLATTVMLNGKIARVSDPQMPATSRFDCFYVYPTVSNETSANADLRIQAQERDVAFAQASRFSQACNVWAPIYRQVTTAALRNGRYNDPAYQDIAYRSLLHAWRDYLKQHNHGRPVVFIGHSQGAQLLLRLLHNEVDPNPTLRRQLVVAILLGGNVVVADKPSARGSFEHIAPCRSANATGCVIAYSTFSAMPPTNSIFGIPGQGISLPVETARTGVRVVCTNPGALAGAATRLTAYFTTGHRAYAWAPVHSAPTSVTTPWVAYRGLFTAVCRQHGNATWLAVTRNGWAKSWPHLRTAPPQWGMHMYDMALALGRLVSDVKAEEAAYEAHR